jgi:secreted trypsin-like serine protease
MQRSSSWTGTRRTRTRGTAVAVIALILAVVAPTTGAAPRAVTKRLTVGPQTASMVPLGRPSHAKAPRIISGTKAPDGSWPWIVSVRQASNPNSGFCGGSVVAGDMVLTAAHCVVVDDAKGFPTKTVRPPSDFVVVSGQHLITPITGQVRNVTKIVVHPAWNGAAGNYGADAALVFLAQPVSAPPIVMADLPFETAVFNLQNPAEWAAGWGSITTHTEDANGNVVQQATYPNELWNVQLDLFTPQACNQAFPKTPPFWTVWHLCAGRLPATTCNGDSGGPHLVQRTDGLWTQIGVTSVGLIKPLGGGFIYCASYDGITRVAAVSAWAIEQWKLYEAHKPVPDRTAPQLRVLAQKVKRRHSFNVYYRVFDASGETTDSIVVRFHGRAVARARYGFGEAKNKLYFFRVKTHLKAGMYRIEISSHDRAGNRSVAKAKLRVR